MHGLRGVEQRGHAQVDDLDLRRQLGRGGGRGRVAEDHVLGLDVAVHDAVAVHVRDGLRQLPRAARARASGAQRRCVAGVRAAGVDAGGAPGARAPSPSSYARSIRWQARSVRHGCLLAMSRAPCMRGGVKSEACSRVRLLQGPRLVRAKVCQAGKSQRRHQGAAPQRCLACGTYCSTRRCAPGRAPRLREQEGRLLLGVVLARHLLQLVKEVAAAQPLLRARARVSLVGGRMRGRPGAWVRRPLPHALRFRTTHSLHITHHANTAGSIYPEPSALRPGQAVQRRARPGSQASHPAAGPGPRPDSEQLLPTRRACGPQAGARGRVKGGAGGLLEAPP